VGIARSNTPTLNPIQAIQQVRVTADPTIYGLPANTPFQYQYGLGTANLNRALSLSSPAIRLTNWETTDQDGNGIYAIGDTVRLVLNLINYLAPAGNLSVSITPTPASAVQVIGGPVSLGAVSTLGTVSNANTPLRFRVMPGTLPNTVVSFRVTYTNGLYTDYECLELVVNPTFVNVNRTGDDALATSIDNIGHFGYVGAQGSNNGQGVAVNLVDAPQQYLYEGGFLIGTDSTRLADNIRRGPGLGSSNDFRATQSLTNEQPWTLANQRAVATFADSALANPNKLEVREEVFAWNDSPDDRFILMRYIIRNTGFTSLTGVRTGWFADWDLGNPTNDIAGYDATNRLAWARGDDATGNTNNHVGIAVISNGLTVHAWADTASGFAYTDTAKWQAIGSGTANASLNNTDVVSFLGVGPFNLGPLQTDTVVVALVAGTSLSNILSNTQAARQKYLCNFEQTPLTVNIAGATTACGQADLDATTPGATSYQWNTVPPTAAPLVSVTQNGTYTATVFTASGCAYTGQATVTIVPPIVAQANISPTTTGLNQQGAVTFVANTPGATQWTWDFGDGFGFTGPTVTYNYTQTGQYTATLVVSNGVCFDTLTQTITVLQTSSLADPVSGLQVQVLPNPVHDRLILTAQQPAGSVQVTVHDALGRTLLTTPWNTATPLEWSVAEWPVGVYSVRAGTTLLRVVVQ
jgi:PKD repeat protein